MRGRVTLLVEADDLITLENYAAEAVELRVPGVRYYRSALEYEETKWVYWAEPAMNRQDLIMRREAENVGS